MSERKVVKLLICITPEWDAAIRKRLKPFEVRQDWIRAAIREKLAKENNRV
jgi:hypothetical protein